MGFENFLNQASDVVNEIKKKASSAAKIATIGAIGLVPNTTEAGDKVIDSLSLDKKIESSIGLQGEKLKAWSVIKSDTDMGMVEYKESYYRQFPNISQTEIDSMLDEASSHFGERNDSIVAPEPLPEKEVEMSVKRMVGAILYPDQAESIMNGDRFIPPSEWIIKAYKDGKFKTREEFLKNRDALSGVYNK
jgi:hypothetical protein